MFEPGDQPRVSCVITTFNYAHFVGEAIESALAQSYGQEALEVIVVDGASTDDTPAVVERYAPRVTYIREPANEGVVSSANRGLEAASGELIAFLNADDAWYPTTVERLVGRLAVSPDSGLVYGDMEMIDAEGRPIHRSYYERFGVHPASGRLLGRLLRGNFIASGCFMFRRSLLALCHPIPPDVPWEDWYIVVRLAEATRFEYLPEPVLRYRFHGHNQVLMADGRRLLESWRKELPFRRRLLAELRPHAVSAADVVGAVAAFDDALRRLADAAPGMLAEALPIGEAEVAAAEDAAAAATGSQREGDGQAALVHMTHALARDPHDRELRRRFAELAEDLLKEDERGLEERREELERLVRTEPPAVERAEHEPLEEVLFRVQDLSGRLGSLAPAPDPEPRALEGMLERIEDVDLGDRAAALTELHTLGPPAEASFPLGPQLRLRRRPAASGPQEALLAELPDDLAGRRVLDLRSQAGYVAFALSLRGPDELVACDPGPGHRQALALERLYRSGIDFRPLGWEDVTPDRLGRFDLVHADGLLEVELRQLPLLERLRELLAGAGRAYLGFARLGQPDRSEHVHLAPAADGGTLALPGRVALRWMVEAAGLAPLREIAVRPWEVAGIPVERGYLELGA